MTLKKIALASLCLVFFLSIVSQAQDVPPNVPFVQQQLCPFECCQYGEWIARTALMAYKKEGSGLSVVFSIKPGEKFLAIRGNVHIIKLGVFDIKNSFDDFIKGDKVYVLSYRGEGIYDLWYKGKVFRSTDQFWANGVLMTTPKMIWWVLVKNKDGKQGWLKLKNISESGFETEEKIDGVDSCS